MTLTKYWVNSYSVAPFAVGTTNQVVMHLAADVDKVVAEWQKHLADGEAAYHSVRELNTQLQADLARVTAELEKVQNEIARIRMWEMQREPDCSDIKECKP